jgi:hypothetical protein
MTSFNTFVAGSPVATAIGGLDHRNSDGSDVPHPMRHGMPTVSARSAVSRWA